MGTIGMAVVFAILLVTANAMMMSARERTGETGGAQDHRLLRPARCSGWCMLEAGIITAHRAPSLGLGGGEAALQAPPTSTRAGFLPGFDVTADTLAAGRR